MHRVNSYFLMFASMLLFGCAAWAQDNPNAATATCNFDEDKQLVVQYQRVSFNLKKPISVQVPFGKVWSPGGKPMTLFTNTAVQVGSRVLPIGAYTMWVIPTNKQWTLVISKATDINASYNEQDDLVRVPMQSGELPNPEPDFNVSFAHVAADQCSIRVDLDKEGHFEIFHLK